MKKLIIISILISLCIIPVQASSSTYESFMKNKYIEDIDGNKYNYDQYLIGDMNGDKIDDLVLYCSELNALSFYTKYQDKIYPIPFIGQPSSVRNNLILEENGYKSEGKTITLNNQTYPVAYAIIDDFNTRSRFELFKGKQIEMYGNLNLYTSNHGHDLVEIESEENYSLYFSFDSIDTNHNDLRDEVKKQLDIPFYVYQTIKVHYVYNAKDHTIDKSLYNMKKNLSFKLNKSVELRNIK